MPPSASKPELEKDKGQYALGFFSSALLSPFLGEGSPTKIDYRKKGTLVLTSLLEDLLEKDGGQYACI